MKRPNLKLPERFLTFMARQFGDSGMETEWGSFLASFDQKPVSGIRGNLSKCAGRAEFMGLLEKMGITEPRPVPWSACGFLLPQALSSATPMAPGRQPYYHAGLFYLQEPSAMLPAEVLDARPGEYVMDLCAAPGGKSTRIAECMHGRGLLFCNDIHPERVRALIRNLELNGASNTVVLNDPPAKIADRMPAFFDRVLVDAPCSGEGMFRRDRRAVAGWDRFGSEACTVMQDGILHEADRMLRPGGTLVYSTCTFSHVENEGTIARFLSLHPEYAILPITRAEGMSPGIHLPGSEGLSAEMAGKVVRIWPHRANGEGHFCALLRKGRETVRPDSMADHPATAVDLAFLIRRAGVRLGSDAAERLDAPDAWIGESLSKNDVRKAETSHVHWLPSQPPDLAGLRIVKHGLYAGTKETDRSALRFEPSHSFLLTLRAQDIEGRLDLALQDERVMRYLRGETLALLPSEKGLDGMVPVFVDGYPLGWGKADSTGTLKNLYPKAWRRMT